MTKLCINVKQMYGSITLVKAMKRKTLRANLMALCPSSFKWCTISIEVEIQLYLSYINSSILEIIKLISKSTNHFICKECHYFLEKISFLCFHL